MSIEDDVALLECVPTLRVLGEISLRMLAFASESRELSRGDVLFNAGEPSDSGFIVQRGSFEVASHDGAKYKVVARPGDMLGELALVVPMPRPATVTALEDSAVIRIARSMFQRVLESDPAAARRLRDEFAARVSQMSSDMLIAGAKLGS
jgi:CRP-like cAMP-binding protein